MATDQMEQDQSPVSEYEPFDTEKEKYIDEEFHVEVTTHLRKTCPPQIKTKLKNASQDHRQGRRQAYSKYEPFDTEKEKYIDEQLMERFHMNVEVTTHLRKTCPPQIKTKLKKIYRHEWKHICRSQTNAADSKTESENNCPTDNQLNDCEGTINQDQINERLGACSQKIEDVNTNVKDVLTKTKELIKSSEMCQRFKGSESYKLVYETPPSTPEKINTDTQCSSNMLHNKCISSELNI